jgi:hypothetical protein
MTLNQHTGTPPWPTNGGRLQAPQLSFKRNNGGPLELHSLQGEEHVYRARDERARVPFQYELYSCVISATFWEGRRLLSKDFDFSALL